jgi:hypothetical protein
MKKFLMMLCFFFVVVVVAALWLFIMDREWMPVSLQLFRSLASRRTMFRSLASRCTRDHRERTTIGQCFRKSATGARLVREMGATTLRQTMQ